MRYTGEKSLSSFVKIFLEFMFYLMIIVNILIIVDKIFGLKLLRPNPQDFEYRGMRFKRPHNIKIPIYIEILRLIIGVLNIYIVYSLKVIFRNFSKEKIFDKLNFIKLKQVALVMLIIGLINSILSISRGRIVNEILKKDHVIIKNIFDLVKMDIFIYGLAILIFAEIFNNAIKIKQENDFTI